MPEPTVSDQPTVARGFVAPGYEHVLEQFERNFTTRGDVGAAFAVCRGREMLVDLWGGSSTPPDRPWTRDTLQLLFSGTEGLVATCLLVLIDRGELDLDAPVSSYWPEFGAAGKAQLTVAELVSHRARLPGVDASLAIDDVLDGAALAGRLAAQHQSDDPRAGGVYHALTYGWLCGGLVQSITGATIGELFAQHVARPLDLELWIGLPAAEEPRVSTLMYGPHWGSGPQLDEAALANDPLLASVWANPMLFPAHELVWNRKDFHAAEIPGANGIGTARSMAQLYACLAAGGRRGDVELLSPATVALGRRELSRFVDPLTQEPMAYGAGFQLQTEMRRFGPPEDAFGHAGAGGSVHAAWPTQGVGVSYVMNELRDDPAGDPRTTALLDALHEALRAEGGHERLSTSLPVALVTGAAGGIGRAICERLIADGYDVLAVDRHPDEAGPGSPFAADLTTRAGNRAAVEAAIERFGRLDVVVANAGIQHVAPIADFPEDRWDDILALLLTSPFLLARYAWPSLVESPRARIVVVASAHALAASPFKAAYVSAKHGVLGLVKTLALEGAEAEILATAVCPAFVRTPLVTKQIAAQAAAHGLKRGGGAGRGHPRTARRQAADRAGGGSRCRRLPGRRRADGLSPASR